MYNCVCRVLPVLTATCLALAAEIVRRETGRPCQKLTTMWWRRFKKRNPTVTTKRLAGDLLEATIEKHSIAPGQLWNVDEKGFNPDPIPKRVVTARASKAQQQHKRSHDHITANICINACGNHLPPQLIYNRAQLTTRLVENGPPGAIYCTSKTGSMDRELFQSWFKDLFLASTSREKTQLILMDNHSSHISVEILELARKSNVVFIALPSKTTHILQPLDKTVFSAMGAHHQSTSAAARLLKPSHSLALSDFLPIFADTFTKSVTPANIMASFKVTGVYRPTDRRVIPQHVLAPSEVHRAESGMEPLSPEEEALFQRRVSEGYDVPDARYDMWKAARAAPTQDTGFVEMPLATSLVTAGVISPSTASIFMTPAVTPRRLPSAASQARTLTSDEFFTALIQTVHGCWCEPKTC
eukprot:scpid4122/ scgid6187/ Tigger transposable element-derived protein 1